jgi:hypothetical protein
VLDAVGDRAEVYVDGRHVGQRRRRRGGAGGEACPGGTRISLRADCRRRAGVGRAANILVQEVRSTLALLGVRLAGEDQQLGSTAAGARLPRVPRPYCCTSSLRSISDQTWPRFQ